MIGFKTFPSSKRFLQILESYQTLLYSGSSGFVGKYINQHGVEIGVGDELHALTNQNLKIHANP